VGHGKAHFCKEGSKEVLLVGSAQSSKKIDDGPNQYGPFPKNKSKNKKKRSNEYELHYAPLILRYGLGLLER
jgi:hypothetical protein